MKLWQKTSTPTEAVETFTVGKDRELDLQLASYDVLGSLAHIQMLESVGLLSKTELGSLQTELKNIHAQINAGDFKLNEGIEDIHSQVEFMLTQKLGEAGKKISNFRRYGIS